MSIKSIKIKNLLSFDELIIGNFEDINCIVGKNNAGKSNLLKLLRYFYNKLDDKRELPPLLYSDYSSFGIITIQYNISHIKKIVTANKNISNEKLGYFKKIYNLLILNNDSDTFELTLKIYANDSIEWNIKDKKTRKIIADIYPFFDIEARHIALYDWNKLWVLVSRMKPFNPHKVKQKDVIEFFDEKLNNSDSENYKNYEKYIKIIEENLETGSYNYSQKVLSFVKSGLKGQSFLIGQEGLETQSDGTNSHKFIETFISLLILLTRKAYITPILYIDEPEVGLHPKRNEELIENIYETYKKVESKTPYPSIILTTHSPNIVKQVIKLFGFNQQILHFSKKEIKNIQNKYFKVEPTVVQKMNSQYDDPRFLNVFSDNEARLFFSNFILFVEGATEVEIFRNQQLNKKFKVLKDIDVYEVKESVLKYINPSYSNTSIPYLVLYDADKFMMIDFDNKKLIQPTRGNVINHVTLEKKYQNIFFKLKKETIEYFNLLDDGLSFFKKYKEKNNINIILNNQYLISQLVKYYLTFFNESKIEIEKNLFVKKIKYKSYEYSYDSFIEFGNQIVFSQENKFFNKTTIEEVLINKNSFGLFKRWFYSEFKQSIKKSYNSKSPIIFIQKTNKSKIKEIKKFRQYLNNTFTEEERITAMILIFGGKTETSITTVTDNYTKLSVEFREGVQKLKKSYIQKKKSLNLDYLLGKTSGWATRFLDFSIYEIEKKLKETDFEKREKEFRDEFKKYFGELYDIITIIEDKLDFDR